ncbi:hypothetical protein AVEN_167072-1 [Araneus ventricosus]|uniref:Uncharacterized protein n=1 Tax=Araneus ventricosus TaxID=182803 RepID=A0A4Y2CPA5_ARAVE|nr:hypothetical protein AVEN_167072-1 [Araneus ventricosus]
MPIAFKKSWTSPTPKSDDYSQRERAQCEIGVSNAAEPSSDSVPTNSKETSHIEMENLERKYDRAQSQLQRLQKKRIFNPGWRNCREKIDVLQTQLEKAQKEKETLRQNSEVIRERLEKTKTRLEKYHIKHDTVSSRLHVLREAERCNYSYRKLRRIENFPEPEYEKLVES